MTTTKKELSYFRLKLENYLSEHFPEMLSDKSFITTRADEALTAYCDAVTQGFSHPEAETMASEVLYQDLHFSKYDTLVSVWYYANMKGCREKSTFPICVLIQ